MRRWLPPFLILAGLAALIWVCWSYEHGLAHALGIDTQGSQEYDFVSGVGPMIITSLGYLGLTGTLVHRFNCHERGCWRPGRYHIGAGVWCRIHQEKAQPEVSDSQRLEQIERHLERIAALMQPHPDLRPDLRETPEAPQ